MKDIQKHLNLLGMTVQDKVTRFKGIIDTISFDLYGCVQAGVNPGIDKEDAQRECRWFDITRLKVMKAKRVMQLPDFSKGYISEGKKGPADKPLRHSN